MVNSNELVYVISADCDLAISKGEGKYEVITQEALENIVGYPCILTSSGGFVPASDLRTNEAIGTGSFAGGMGAVAYSRASKSLGYRTQTGYPPNAELAATRPEALSIGYVDIANPISIKASDEKVSVNCEEKSIHISKPANSTESSVEIDYPITSLTGKNVPISFVFVPLSGLHGWNGRMFVIVTLNNNKTVKYGHIDTFGNMYENGLPTGRTSCEFEIPGNASKVTLQFVGLYGMEFRLNDLRIEQAYFAENVGQAAVAIGADTIAVANNALAGGHKSIASGVTSLAFGGQNKAEGNHSVALGTGTKSLGKFSFSMGNTNTAEGDGSFAVGESSRAVGKYSTVIGHESRANSNHDVVIGRSLKSSKKLGNQTVLGKYNQVDDEALLIIGNGADASSRSNAFTVNKTGTVKATGLNITGKSNIGTGVKTISGVLADKTSNNAALGWQAEANASSSFAAGAQTKANGYGSAALGNKSITNGQSTFAAGEQVQASSTTGQAVVGKYNEVTNDAMFVVGNGSSDTSRSNALVVDKDGNVYANGDKRLATEEYVNKIKGTAGIVTNGITESTATGQYSLAGGFESNASGDYSIALGDSANAIGDHSIAVGSENYARGIASVVMGAMNEVTEDADAAAVFGYNNKATGDYVFIAGNLNKTDPTKDTHCAAVFGKNNTAVKTAQFICGEYSKPTEDMQFVVGNGDWGGSDDEATTIRKNAFAVHTNGAIEGGARKEVSGAPDNEADWGDIDYWRYNEAVGTGSMAMGMGAVAYSRASKSLGYRTQAGYPSSKELADARPEALIQKDANGNTIYPAENVAQAAVAIGADTISVGKHSLAGGYKSVASGENSIAFGSQCQSTNKGSVAMGFGAKADGEISISLGDNTKANGLRGFAVGVATEANGNYSTALGHTSKANGNHSFAVGSKNNANGIASVALGGENIVTGDGAVALGFHNVAQVNYQAVLGTSNIASDSNEATGQTIVGKFNNYKNGVIDNAIFVVGNGEHDNARSNAFVVYTDGSVKIAGALSAGSIAQATLQKIVDAVFADDAMGDIETALDSIIAIQNSLIGGEKQ